MDVYFDNSATTKPCPEAVEAVSKAMTQCWGNPSSLHSRGLEADDLLQSSRAQVAKRISCSPEEIVFTSGGTESNNLALAGAAHKLSRLGNRIVSTAVEHPSVYETLTQLQAEGFEVIRLGVNSEGKINEEELFEAVNENTILVSIMAVNNEVGSIQPVKSAKMAIAAAHSPALVHCDAVQVFGKLPFKPSALGIDLMSISSHKIHGPKGIGALYIKKGIKIAPRTFGGLQEGTLRPGTEAMPAIAGFGAAAKAMPDPAKELGRITELRDYMVNELKKLDSIAINSPADALPYITNISVLGKRSEPMMSFLSDCGICVSSGSACSKGKKSRVLEAMGLSFEAMQSPLRISFSHNTTKEEIDYFLEKIALGQKIIRGSK